MRIPSQFNEDSLYRRHKGRTEASQTYRRLIRLLLAVVLVVVVMRQSSKPAVYQTFFGPQASQVATSDSSQDVPGGEIGLRQPPSRIQLPVDREDRRVANLLTHELPPEAQREWIVALSRWQSGQSRADVPETIEAIREQLESIEINDQQRLAWQTMIESFANSSMPQGSGGSTVPPSVDQPAVRAFLAALDDAAASRVVDGSVWRSGDFDSFYRYLDQADDLPSAGIAATGVLPLLQQPDVFRNQLVRAHGGVARAERIDAEENAFGITEYWQLWLRPSDGVDRPLVAIVPSVPPLVESVGRNAIAKEGPQVIIVGRFLKRLAYESSVGADLAPVVVGRIAQGPNRVKNEMDDQAASDVPFRRRLWLTVAGASLFGFALAAIAIWRTSVMATRARALRTAHRTQPDQFLQGLGETVNHHDSADEVSR